MSSMREARRKNPPDNQYWYGVVGRVAIGVLAYPFDYVKVLIQLGYEPIAPRPTRRLFGQRALALPGAFEYMGYIKKVDGFTGLYRGLSPAICTNIIASCTVIEVNKRLPPVISFEEEEEIAEITDQERIINFIKRTSRVMAANCCAIIASQPFHVVTIRYMAQFVGGETKYTGILQSLHQICKEEGILGLFSGVVPKLIGDTLKLWLASTVAFIISAYLVEDRTVQSYISVTVSFLASSIMYPFNLVSTVMAANNSGLLIAQPPHMPEYPSWTECWNHLSRIGQLKRGSTLFLRYYQGPLILQRPGSNPGKVVTAHYAGPKGIEAIQRPFMYTNEHAID